MAATATLSRAAPDAPPSAVLTLLREAALACRAAPRLDAPRACRVLDAQAGADEVAQLLMRVVPQVMRGRPVLHAPRTPGHSFDETWLMALHDAVARGDRASERFLIARRCRPERAPVLSLMMRALVERTGSSCRTRP